LFWFGCDGLVWLMVLGCGGVCDGLGFDGWEGRLCAVS
jgi:hypothetical protein